MDPNLIDPNCPVETPLPGCAQRPVTTTGVAQPARSRSAALVTMPFVKTSWPSIQLGLLKQIAVDRGHSVTSLHLNLDFAAQLGADDYDALCDGLPDFLGEWLFALAAFETEAPDQAVDLLDSMAPETLG